MAPHHTYRNSPRKHFPPDRQGAPRKYNHPVVSGQQRYNRRHNGAAPACSGCGGPPHDDRRMCKAWGRTYYKYQKQNHFANVCKANIQQAHLVENDTHSQSSDTLCEDTYTLGLYHTSATHSIPPYMCNVQIDGSELSLEIDTGSSVSLIEEGCLCTYTRHILIKF